MNYTVRKDKRYKAEIKLGMIEQAASNETIRRKLLTAGFVNVIVWGQGRTRTATGTWPKADATAPVPKQIVKLTEV